MGYYPLEKAIEIYHNDIISLTVIYIGWYDRGNPARLKKEVIDHVNKLLCFEPEIMIKMVGVEEKKHVESKKENTNESNGMLLDDADKSMFEYWWSKHGTKSMALKDVIKMAKKFGSTRTDKEIEYVIDNLIHEFDSGVLLKAEKYGNRYRLVNTGDKSETKLKNDFNEILSVKERK